MVPVSKFIAHSLIYNVKMTMKHPPSRLKMCERTFESKKQCKAKYEVQSSNIVSNISRFCEVSDF